MADLNRRSFLGYTAGTAMAGFGALQGFDLSSARPSLGRRVATLGEGSYGPLQTAARQELVSHQGWRRQLQPGSHDCIRPAGGGSDSQLRARFQIQALIVRQPHGRR